MSKSNKVEIDKRILEVSKMLLSGNSTKDICYYALLNWDISESQVKRYIRHCYTLWHKEFKKKSKANLNYQLAKRKDLYNKAYEGKDWQTCLSIAKDESKILDLYPSLKQSIEVEKKPDSQEMLSKHYEKELMKLEAKDLKKIIKIFETKSEEEILMAIKLVTGSEPKLLKEDQIL